MNANAKRPAPKPPTAVIIGASSGIGAALAAELSRAGYRLGLAARRHHKLMELSRALEGVETVMAMDLQQADVAGKQLRTLIGALGDVDLIVIAAGTGKLNPRLESAPEQATAATNVCGFTAVALAAVQYFRRRGSGHLVAISSVAGLRGGRGSPAYNASKAYVSNYLEGLRQWAEHAQIPMTVTDVRPGYVDTDLAQGGRQFWMASAETAARQIMQGIGRKRACIYVTRRWRLVAALLRIFPEPLYRRL